MASLRIFVTEPQGGFRPLAQIGVDGVPQVGCLIEAVARGVPMLVRVSMVAWQRSPEPGWAAYGDVVEDAFGSASVHLAGGLTRLTGGACNRVTLDDPGFIDATARLVAATGHGVPPGAGALLRGIGEELDAIGGINAMYTASKVAGVCNGSDAEADIDRAFHGVGTWSS